MTNDIEKDIMDVIQDATDQIDKAKTYWVAMLLVLAFFTGWNIAEAFLG